MKKRVKISLLCMISAILSLHTVWADNVIFNPVAGDWNNTANWSKAALPTTADTAIMNNGRVVSVNNAVGTTAGAINVANQLAGFTAGMNVNAGGSLSYEGILYIGAAGATGTVNIAGGALTSVNTGSRTVMQSGANSTFNLSSGTFTAQGSAATDALTLSGVTMNISGGTLDMSGGQVIPQNNPVFNITGDAAAITMDRLNMNVASRASDWNFTLGSNGVSSVNNGAFLHLAYANIHVDGSAYTGPGGLIDLFTAPNVATTAINPANITGFRPEYSVVYEQDTTGNYSRLNISFDPAAIDTNALVLALGDLTNAPTMFADDMTMATTNVQAGELNAIYYDALDYNGSPTRVYAYIGLPAGASSNSPVPGVVLVHGGGGTAFEDWVTLWTNRGYAAISIAVEGQTDSTAPPTMNTGWHIHNMPGPVRDGIYGDSGEALTNQWMYHAVADTVLANSLLRSLPEVNAANVGLMGISWGGVITSTTIGIDDRFRFAIPTYGCGDLADADNQYGVALGDNNLYKEVWDPMVRITNATMPAMWFSWPQDQHFPMDSLANCYTNAPGPRMVSLVPGMGHGHSAAWNRPESYAFADSIVIDGTPWCVQTEAGVSGGVCRVSFASSKPLDNAKLVSTVNTGFTGDRTWTETPATLVANGGGSYTVTTTLPDYTTAWFINGLSGTLVASSDYQETKVQAPSNIVYDVTTNWSSQTVNGNDTVTINSGATVALDTNAAAATLTVNDDAYTLSTLMLNQGFDLAISGEIELGKGTGAGFVVQSNGAVSAASLAVNSSGTGYLSKYKLLGGTLSVANAMEVNTGGMLALNGGTLVLDNELSRLDVTGSGRLEIESGTFNNTASDPTDLMVCYSDVEIRGGTINLTGQNYFAGEFRLVGNDASISIDRLNNTAALNGHYIFEFDADGVSTVSSPSWINLRETAITVDGSAYAGGAATFLLFDAINLATIADANDISVSGFSKHGLVASVVQDQTDGNDWVQLVLDVHAATTVTYSVSANWSSMDVFGNDAVVIGSGTTVTVDTDAFADDLQIDGTLLFQLDTTGVEPLTLSGTLTVNGGIEVDDSAYEGLDGYFPLILSASLSSSLTNDVTLIGFGAREPAVVVQADGLWLRLVAPPSLSQRLCSLIPDSTVAADYSNSTFSSSRAYEPSGSAWSLSFDEAHVLDTRLSQDVSGDAVLSWDLRTGRGGFVYSLRTDALGETVPPSFRSDGDTSPWNDEVWQGVAVDSSQNDPDNGSPYFTHQSGAYLKDPVLTEPFYSPQVSAHLNAADRSFTTINWIPQAHINIYTDENPVNDFKSYLLMFTRYRDLGQGVIEVSLGYYNYGPDTLDFLNMPWGGVRRTSTEYAFISGPGGAGWSAPVTNGWGDSSLLSKYNDTGGWVGFSATSNGATPALGLVYGQDHATPLPDQNRAYSTFRCGYAGGTPTGNQTDWRNYFVTSNIRWYNLTEGDGLWSRHYFVLGDNLTDLASRISSRNLVAPQLAEFNYTEASSPLVAYSTTGSGASFRIEENGRSPDFFLYAHPVSDSVPIFEVIEADESRYLTWNPYANGIVKPYDGRMAGLRLLGFAMPASGVHGTYAALSGLLPSENYLPDSKTLYVRTATPIETWRVEYFGKTDDADDGANTANPDNDPVANLAEYALGGNPTNASDIGYLPMAGTVDEGGTNFFEYIYPRRIGSSSELAYFLETCSNLLSNDWTVASYRELPTTGTMDAEFEAVTNRIDTTGKPNEFVRLSIEAL